MFRPRLIPRVVACFFKQAFRMPLSMTEDIYVGRICTDLIGHKVLSVPAQRVGFESVIKHSFRDIQSTDCI